MGKSTAVVGGGHRLAYYERALHYIKLKVWTRYLVEPRDGSFAFVGEVEGRVIWRTKPLSPHDPDYTPPLRRGGLFEGTTTDLLKTLSQTAQMELAANGKTLLGLDLEGMRNLYRASISTVGRCPHVRVCSLLHPQSNRRFG